jgi:5-methylcytosine-specific restriction enzyme subunit McrC
LYVYHEFYDAARVALIYPGTFKPKKGLYYTKDNVTGNKECSVMGIKVITNISLWREEIGKNILSWARNDLN